MKGTITRALAACYESRDPNLHQAIELIYEDLQIIARKLWGKEPHSPVFDTDSLVQETYIALTRQSRTQWKNRHHLFAVATRIMRRILVDRARARNALKRGGVDARFTPLDGKDIPEETNAFDVVTLDKALRDLEQEAQSLAQIVELRFFGGLNNHEIAAIQGVTPMTVIRRWRLAKAWLQRRLVDGRQ